MLTSPDSLPNVILWAVSRSRSTAFEPAVMQHPEVRVLDPHALTGFIQSWRAATRCNARAVTLHPGASCARRSSLTSTSTSSSLQVARMLHAQKGRAG